MFSLNRHHLNYKLARGIWIVSMINTDVIINYIVFNIYYILQHYNVRCGVDVDTFIGRAVGTALTLDDNDTPDIVLCTADLEYTLT